MPRGGARPGSGPKPKRREAVVLGLDGQRQKMGPKPDGLPPAVDGETKEALLVAPYWLTEAARGYWERWAVQALAERTLTPSTAAGFVELCQRADYVGKLAFKIASLGADTQDALPYLNLYDRMSRSLETSLARFKLTAFGKPATSDKPKAAENPWAQVVAK